ncbi:DUF4189 domain-containing protein [Luteibacter sp.]|jgi:hypothetical protein|uniref:DUF4189 domain-containing protein n=1 Tax=Luteibacter sp. TaxID=1886636 RepID=UPI0039C93B45
MNALHRTFLALLSLHAGVASAQCAPGIPSAGNPGCIPPNQQSSPYYQGQTDVEAATPVEVPARWADRWGAISLDDVDSKAGATIGKASEREASRGALAVCKEHDGSHCEVVITYHNQCAAVAQKDTGGLAGLASAASIDEAKELAIRKCSDNTCRVIYGACSYAEQVQ